MSTLADFNKNWSSAIRQMNEQHRAASAEAPCEPQAQSARYSAADGSAPCFISARDDDLARDMACFLWESSRLRHGLFTPPEFILLVSARLREYLTTHRPNHQR